MYVVEKKITGWIVLQYKIIITKYQNIAINSLIAHPVSSILLLLYLKQKQHQEHR
jgi:energy-converting hydrogenase Eha subunit C